MKRLFLAALLILGINYGIAQTPPNFDTLMVPNGGAASSINSGTTGTTCGNTQVLFANAGTVGCDAGLTKVAGAAGAVTAGGNLIVEVGSGGFVQLTPGDATHTGHIDWWTANAAVRVGFMGFDTGTAAITLNLNASDFFVSGGGLVLSSITTDATHTDSTLCQDTTTHKLFFGSGAAGACLGTSSIRFKHDVLPLEPGLRELLALETVSYRYNEGYGDPSRKLYGFTAEQVQTVIPELVGLDTEGRPNSVDWAGLVPVLVKAIQQQQAEIDDLKRRVR